VGVSLVRETLPWDRKLSWIGFAWTRSDADAAHMRKASGVMQMRQTRQMQMDEDTCIRDACIRDWRDELTSREAHSLYTATRWSLRSNSTIVTFQRLCGTLWSRKMVRLINPNQNQRVGSWDRRRSWGRTFMRVGSWERRRSWGRRFIRHKVFLNESSLLERIFVSCASCKTALVLREPCAVVLREPTERCDLSVALEEAGSSDSWIRFWDHLWWLQVTHMAQPRQPIPSKPYTNTKRPTILQCVVVLSSSLEAGWGSALQCSVWRCADV